MPVDSLFEVAPRWWVRTFEVMHLCVVAEIHMHAPIKDGRERTGLDRRHQYSKDYTCLGRSSASLRVESSTTTRLLQVIGTLRGSEVGHLGTD